MHSYPMYLQNEQNNNKQKDVLLDREINSKIKYSLRIFANFVLRFTSNKGITLCNVIRVYMNFTSL